MPPRKRARKAAEAPGPNKKRRPSPDASDHAEDEANAIACPQSITMPSPTDSSDPAVLDEEDAPFEAPQSEAATAEGMNIATDEASEKPQQVRARAGGGGGYNALKSFNGQVYTGMAVGGSHTWNYDAGTWKETKQEPDLWKVDYQTTKRRARAAPKGSGAPVGAEYHWLIVAHQVTSCPLFTSLSVYDSVGGRRRANEDEARKEARCEHVLDTPGGLKVQARAQVQLFQGMVGPDGEGAAREGGGDPGRREEAGGGLAAGSCEPEG